MSNRIITISREFGSGGHSIGKLVSEMLGIEFYDKEIVRQVAQKSGYSSDFVEEHGEYAPTTSSFLFNLAFSANWSRLSDGLSPSDQLYILQNNIIREIADEKPCIIVGRCANFVLKERTDVLNVFIYASKEARAKRIVARYGDNGIKPETRVKKKDEQRKVYYKHYTGEEWGLAQNYHISLDSDKIGIETCADRICELYSK